MNSTFQGTITWVVAVPGLTLAAATNQIPSTSLPVQTLPTTRVVGASETDMAAPVRPLTSPDEQEARKRLSEVPGAISFRDTQDMNRGLASGFQDLLARTPGVILQSENSSEVGEISIRGSGVLSDEEPIGVAFRLDGFVMNQADGETILEDYDIGSIRYAEIFRGANAFRYGAITLGGAINLISKTGYDARPFETRLEGGSFGFFRGQVASGGVEGPMDYHVSVTGRRSDGFREHQAENSEGFAGNLGWKISDSLENRTYLSLSRTDRQRPGGLTKEDLRENPRQADPEAISQDLNRSWTYSRIADKLTYKTGPTEVESGLYWWHRSFELRDYYNDESRDGIERYYSDNVGFFLNSSTRFEVLGNDNRLTVGVEPHFERQVGSNNQNILGRPGDLTARYSELSVNAPIYLEDQQYLTDRFSVVAGLQAIYAQRRFHNLYTETVTGDTSANLVLRGLNPKIGMVYEFDKYSQLFANYSRSWQPPSFDNMLEFDDTPGGSLVFTPLAAQRAWTAEVGGRGEYGRFRWELALYHSWVRDELLDVNNAQGVNLGAINVPRTEHQGIEAGLETELLNGVFLRRGPGQMLDSLAWEQSYTLTDLHFDHDAVYGNNRIASIPIHLYQGALTYSHPSGFYAGPTLRWSITSFPVDHANTLSSDAYALLGFRIGYQTAKGFSVFLEGRNLTDKRYSSDAESIPDARTEGGNPALFHPGEGRGIYAGLSWRL